MEGKRKKWKKMLMAVSAVMLAAGLAVIIQKNMGYQKGAKDHFEAGKKKRKTTRGKTGNQ